MQKQLINITVTTGLTASAGILPIIVSIDSCCGSYRHQTYSTLQIASTVFCFKGLSVRNDAAVVFTFV